MEPTVGDGPRAPASEQHEHVSGWYVLLLLPFIGVLWVPFYTSVQPDLAGVPFFYWYQFLWVVISAVLTAVVYFRTR